jgi:hypothetical protein
MRLRSFLKSLVLCAILPELAIELTAKKPITTIGWEENTLQMYNKLPYYFANMQINSRNDWVIWDKFLDKYPNKFPTNMGNTKSFIQS